MLIRAESLISRCPTSGLLIRIRINRCFPTLSVHYSKKEKESQYFTQKLRASEKNSVRFLEDISKRSQIPCRNGNIDNQTKIYKNSLPEMNRIIHQLTANFDKAKISHKDGRFT